MVPNDSRKPCWLTLHGFARRYPASCEGSLGIFGDEVSSVTYDPRLGIFAERPAQPAPEWNDDDEFDN
jgi:hypothetical protein